MRERGWGGVEEIETRSDWTAEAAVATVHRGARRRVRTIDFQRERPTNELAVGSRQQS
jgi:hypothetical protein